MHELNKVSKCIATSAAVFDMSATAIPSEKWCESNTEKDYVEFCNKIQVNGNPVYQFHAEAVDVEDDVEIQQLMEGEIVDIIANTKSAIDNANDEIFYLKPKFTDYLCYQKITRKNAYISSQNVLNNISLSSCKVPSNSTHLLRHIYLYIYIYYIYA